MLTLIKPEIETETEEEAWDWETCQQCNRLFETQGETVCFDCKTLPEPNSPVWEMSSTEQAALLRKGLKKICPTLSVRRGRGTAHSWLDLGGSAPYGHMTPAEQAAVEAVGIVGNITPGEWEYFIFKLYPELGNLGDQAKAARRARNERDSWD